MFTKTLEESLQNIEFTTAVVQEKLSKMKPNKAPGIDNFNSSMLREVASSIASPLCEIFNGSIEMGEVPLDWKKANVIIIIITSYAPISSKIKLSGATKPRG